MIQLEGKLFLSALAKHQDELVNRDVRSTVLSFAGLSRQVVLQHKVFDTKAYLLSMVIR